MKNKALAALAALTLLFTGFTSGFFLGRNTRVGTITTTRLVCETVPAETVLVMQPLPTTAPTVPASLPQADATDPQSTETDPSGQSQQSQQTQSSPAVEITYPINVNTADLKALMELPGIGEVIGQRIIDYRNAHGPFRNLDELINVKGIGEKRLAELKPYATV